MSDIPRLSRIEREILGLLISNGAMYGLEMVKASSMLKRGTVYVTLSRMQDKGWVNSTAEKNPNDPGMPRRRYIVSGEGQRIIHDVESAVAFLNMRGLSGAAT